MIRFSIIAVLVCATHSADHITFKDCSRIPYCAALRNNIVDPSSQFAANVGGSQNIFNVALIPLYNSNGETLQLHVSFLVRNKIRARVVENNHDRYILTDVLESLGSTSFSAANIANTTLRLTVQDVTGSYAALVHRGPPFKIEYYSNDQLEVVLNAERLLMQNTDTSQAYTFGVEFERASKLYGLYHHAFKIALNETGGSLDPFRLRNADVPYYEVDSPMSLSSSIPVIYGHSAQQTSGIFLHNAAEQWVDISYRGNRPSAYFIVESAAFDIFVLLGPTPQEVVRQYTSLTGVAHLPQIWALGYHQSRSTYQSQEEVKEVVALMDAYGFPFDAIWLGDGHTNGNRYFEWNPQTFSDPVEMLNNISSTGRKVVAISNPHIKVADDYPVYAGAKGQYFVRWANGSDYEGESLPGLSSYIDFLNPQAREYYANWYAYDKFNGSTETLAGIWNDLNEPSVFDDSLERTLPFETLHYGNRVHSDVHNIYGLLQAKVTHQGLLERDGGTKRPFILSRSHFAGSQRYAAVWTGENSADWSYLASSYSECMTANLLGQVFCGADIGGFLGDPDEELLQRWYQAAVWLPFFRGHSSQESERREPYLFSEDVQSVIRDAIKLRYKHLAVFYTLFYEHVRTGDPIITPLFYRYPEYLEYDDHLLIGPDILSRPVFEKGASRVTVTFPGREDLYWYRVDDNSWTIYRGGTQENIAVDITTSPLFYKGGSIISRLDTERRSTGQMLNDPYTLYVNLNPNDDFAFGLLYVDDYVSFEYQRESYFRVLLVYLPASHGVEIISLGANAPQFNFFIREIIVNGKSPFGTDVSASYRTTRDGVPLESIDVLKLAKVLTSYATTTDGALLESIDIVKLANRRSGEATLHL